MWHNESSLERLTDMVRDVLFEVCALVPVFLPGFNGIFGLLKRLKDDEAMLFSLKVINADVLNA